MQQGYAQRPANAAERLVAGLEQLPLSLAIHEAEGGYIIDCNGKRTVVTSIDDLLTVVREKLTRK